MLRYGLFRKIEIEATNENNLIKDTELMTGWLEPTGIPMPLSELTILSMADFGYDVDVTQADNYIAPGGTLRTNSPTPPREGQGIWHRHHPPNKKKRGLGAQNLESFVKRPAFAELETISLPGREDDVKKQKDRFQNRGKKRQKLRG